MIDLCSFENQYLNLPKFSKLRYPFALLCCPTFCKNNKKRSTGQLLVETYRITIVNWIQARRKKIGFIRLAALVENSTRSEFNIYIYIYIYIFFHYTQV